MVLFAGRDFMNGSVPLATPACQTSHMFSRLRWGAGWAVVLLLMTTIPLRSASAQGTCPDQEGLRSVEASAVLSLDGTDVDTTTWSSRLTVEVDRRSHLGSWLLAPPGSRANHRALACLFGDFFYLPSEQRTTVDADHVSARWSDHGELTTWDDWADPFPWAATTVDGRTCSISLTQPADWGGTDPGEWQSITVRVQGFSITDFTPVPKTADEEQGVDWVGLRAELGRPVASFQATPDAPRAAQFYLEGSGGFGQYAPYDAEGAILLTLLAGSLFRRRAIRPGSAGDLRENLLLLAVVLAVQAWTEAFYDVASQLSSDSQGESAADIVYLSLGALPFLLVGFLAVRGQQKRWIVVGLCVAAGAAVLVEVGQVQLIAPVLVLLSWLALFRVASDITSALGAPRSPRVWIGLAALLTLVQTLSLVFSGYVYPNGDWVVQQVGTAVLLCGVLVWLAGRDGALSPLRDRRARVAVAGVLSYALFLTSPSAYLGIHASVIALAAFLVTYVLLSLMSRHALLNVAAAELSTMSAGQITSLQRRLISAEQRMERIAKDLKSLEGHALSPEQVRWRSELETESDILRRWPSSLPDGWLDPRSGGHPIEHALPGRGDPIGLTLAIGPDRAGNRHIRRGLRWGLLAGLVPAGYFVWASLRGVFGTPVDPLAVSVSIVEVLVQELLFWVVPLLVLAVAWGSLYGTRGSTRAIQVWSCVAIPVGLHWAANQLLHLGGVSLWLTRATLLLALMLAFGLAMDLATLRPFSRTDSTVGLFGRYYRFGRMVAIVTIVLPLLTAAVSLYTQVQTGVLHQQVPASSTREPGATSSSTPSTTTAPARPAEPSPAPASP
jgi:hypothetical protein